MVWFYTSALAGSLILHIFILVSGNIIGKIKDKPFSLSTDGSSDRGADEQLNPIVVRYYDDNVKQVISALLEIATIKGSSNC